jgi:hypothetical protein
VKQLRTEFPGRFEWLTRRFRETKSLRPAPLARQMPALLTKSSMIITFTAAGLHFSVQCRASKTLFP